MAKGLRRFFARLAITLGVFGGIAALILLLPLDPMFGRFEWLQTPLAVLVVICGLGKLLYDTLFFDRYP